MKELTYVGKSLIREDAYDKAKGATKYICDRKLPNMLYAKLVLSEKAHSRIKIDAKKALTLQGIVAVYTYDDVPKNQYNAHSWYEEEGSIKDQYILSDMARFVGDHIALVVGESRECVEEGVSLVEVEYDELPAVVGFKMAASQKHGVAFEKTVSFGDYAQSKVKADFIVTTSGSTQKIHHGAIEPHIALANIDEEENLVLWTPCQTVYQVQYHISRLLEIPYSRVRIIKAVMGGSFGGKGQTVLEPACAFATWKLRRPVMLYMDRSDAIQGTRSRNATQMTVETAVTKDGILLGREIKCDIDGGAYYTNASAIVMALGKKLFRLYRMDSQSYQGRTFFTNTIPGGACRGYGSPQAHAITEINIDQVSKLLQIDPCDLRLKNLLEPMTDDPTGAPNIGNARIKECIEKGREAFLWDEKRAHIKEKNTKRYAYGVGMACGAHGNGYKGAYPDFTNVTMQIYPDGNLLVKIGIHEQGCGTIMTMQQIAAEALCMPVRQIRVTEADTFVTPYDSAGTQASRVTYVCGGAVQKAGTALLEKLKEACVTMYQWEKSQIRVEDGTLFYKTECKTYGEVVSNYEKRCSRTMQLSLEYESPGNPGSYACAFVEVRVDRYTGQCEVLDCLAVHDVGQTMNRQLAEGQVAGGAHMSLGMALFEKIQIDANGQISSRNFSKYHMMNAPDMPRICTMFVEDGEAGGPYGGKSLGEIAAVAPAPATLNAINFALGSEFACYPVTPETIVNYLEKE